MTQTPDPANAVANFYDATVDAFGALFDGCVHTGYWAGGATLGPIIAFAYRAANAAHAEGRSAA